MALNLGRSPGRIDIWAIFWDCQKVQGKKHQHMKSRTETIQFLGS